MEELFTTWKRVSQAGVKRVCYLSVEFLRDIDGLRRAGGHGGGAGQREEGQQLAAEHAAEHAVDTPRDDRRAGGSPYVSIYRRYATNSSAASDPGLAPRGVDMMV